MSDITPLVKPPRILHFIDNIGIGGKERQLVELVKGASARGNTEHLIVSMTEGLFYPELEAVPRVEIHYLIRRWRFDPKVALDLYHLTKQFDADVLVAWDHMTALYAIPAAKLTGARFINNMIQDAPATLTFKAKLRAALTFPVSDAIVSCSRAGLDAYGVSLDDGEVIHNGFDTNRLKVRLTPAEIRTKYNLPDGPLVGMVATFRPTKDQPTLIQAAKTLLQDHPDLCFVFAGDGELLDGCKQLANDIPPHNIAFLGGVQEDLESLINAFTIGVLATFTEGISNSIMEYMALGKAVVATDGGGTSELMVDGQTGLLVPAQQPLPLAEAIATLLADEGLRDEMGRAGRERLLTYFTLEELVRRHLALYQLSDIAPAAVSAEQGGGR